MNKLLLGLTFAALVGAQTQIDWITQVKNKPFQDSRTFNFPAISPGTFMNASTPQTITLHGCPLGVNGSDTNHYLHIQGGTGGPPEYVRITGGTCASGASSGTIQFTPANNHSGLWTLTSATAGLYENQNTLTSGGLVFAPIGTLSVCGLYITHSGITILGQGRGTTLLSCDSTTLPVVSVAGSSVNVHISDIGITRTVTPVSGANGLEIGTGSNQTILERLKIEHSYIGLKLGGVPFGRVSDVISSNNVSHGVSFDSSSDSPQWDLLNILSSQNGGVGYEYTNSSGSARTCPRFLKSHTFANGSYGYKISSSVGSQIFDCSISDSFIGEDNDSGIFLDTRGRSHILSNNFIELEGTNHYSIGYPPATASQSHIGYGIHVTVNNDTTDTAIPVLISGGRYDANSWSGIRVEVQGINIVGITAEYNGAAASSDNDKRAGVSIQGNPAFGSGKVSVTSSTFSTAGNVGFQLFGIQIEGSVNFAILGPNFFDPSLTKPIQFDSAPIYYGIGSPDWRAVRLGTTCTTAASAGAFCDTTYTFPVGIFPENVDFPNTSYTSVCTLTGPVNTPVIGGVANRISGTSIQLRIFTITAVASSAAGVDCILRHD